MADYTEMVKTLRDKATYARIRDGNQLISAEALDALAYAIEELQSVVEYYERVCVTEILRWIPTTEQLPGNGSVLIYSKAGGVAEGKYNPHTGGWTQYKWSAKMEQDVTHWMPLPEPPKEE